MTERKFTDEEVIKALECCANADCLNCPRWSEEWTSGMCNDFLPTVLDLINRQRAEIERLTIEYAGFRGAANSLKMHYNNARAEAIKEFAERLKAYGRKNLTDTESMHFGIIITNVLKELTETPCTDGADCSTCEHCYHDGGYNECATDGVKV